MANLRHKRQSQCHLLAGTSSAPAAANGNESRNCFLSASVHYSLQTQQLSLVRMTVPIVRISIKIWKIIYAMISLVSSSSFSAIFQEADPIPPQRRSISFEGNLGQTIIDDKSSFSKHQNSNRTAIAVYRRLHASDCGAGRTHEGMYRPNAKFA